ncbi:MAG: hypothetical protein AB8G99_25535, partial [Planctomycetaceae bacterium]
MSDQQTPAQQALKRRLARARQVAGTRSTIPRLPDKSSYLTSAGQQRIHYLYNLFPGSNAYHIQLSCQIDGPLD